MKISEITTLFEEFDSLNLCNMLKEFILSPTRNSWLEFDIGKVYVRKSIRFFENRQIKCLDLATVEFDEAERGKGYFKEVLDTFEKVAKEFKFDGVFVESVLNDNIISTLRRNGYAKYNDGEDRSFVKVISKQINEIVMPKSVERGYQEYITKPSPFLKIINTMKKLGWHNTNSGKYSFVFENPKKDYVVKVNYRADPAFDFFANLTRKYRLPNFPKISDMKTIEKKEGNKVQQYGIYLIEKLYPLGGGYPGYYAEYVAEIIRDILWFNGDINKTIQHYEQTLSANENKNELLKKILVKNPELPKAINILSRTHTGNLDIHSDNIMQRKDGTLVITDPYS